MKKFHVILTGGGTAGHVVPALAVAQALRKTASNIQLVISWVGTGEPEISLVKQADIAFYKVHSGKLRRYFSLRNIADVFNILIGIFQSWFLLRKLKPDVVFSKGGFVAVPVGIAAKIRGIPLITHESDTTPGLATRILSRFAKHILLGNPPLDKWTNKPTTFVGNPIRPGLLLGSESRARKRFGLSDKKPVLFVSGGSSGAAAINEIIATILPDLIKHMEIIHQTGSGKSIAVNEVGYTQREFLNEEEMADALAVATVIIGRAGAGSVSEFAAIGKAVIFIPLPRSSSRGDQIANANALALAGAALVLDQDSLDPKHLSQTINSLIKNSDQRLALVEKIKFFARPNAADVIAKIILQA